MTARIGASYCDCCGQQESTSGCVRGYRCGCLFARCDVCRKCPRSSPSQLHRGSSSAGDGSVRGRCQGGPGATREVPHPMTRREGSIW